MDNCKFSTLDIDWFALISAVSCNLILLLGNYFLLVRSELGYETLDVSGVDAQFVECISDVDFIFYEGRELLVELRTGHVEFLV